MGYCSFCKTQQLLAVLSTYVRSPYGHTWVPDANTLKGTFLGQLSSVVFGQSVGNLDEEDSLIVSVDAEDCMKLAASERNFIP